MFVLIRAIVYASCFIGFVLIYVPANLLSRTGLVRPATIGLQEAIGIVTGTAGAILAVWCILTFVVVGKGTPAPFDPPRRLVVRGPYRYVRNPMYIGATLALAGAALFFSSLTILLYAIFVVVATHLFVIWYEEPALRRTFGADYEAYCKRVSRWWPHVKRQAAPDGP